LPVISSSLTDSMAVSNYKHDSKTHALKSSTGEDPMNVALSGWQYPEKTNR